jgi:predicted kinase
MADLADRKTVLVFFGLIASGKSYLASSWAAQHGCTYLNTDVIRKRLAGIEPQSRRWESSGAGIYGGDWTARTYTAMRTMGLEALENEVVPCVVLDGSYRQRSERQKLVVTFANRARLRFFHCHCSEATTKQRLTLRAADPKAVSDGRWEIYLEQQQNFEPPDELHPDNLLRINTEAPLDDLHRAIEFFLVGTRDLKSC